MEEIVNVGEGKEHRQTDAQNRTLKLLLTDGEQTFCGMEQRRLADLSFASPAGIKVCVQDFTVRRGVALFAPDNLRVLGGAVAELEKARLDLLERQERARKRVQLIEEEEEEDPDAPPQDVRAPLQNQQQQHSSQQQQDRQQMPPPAATRARPDHHQQNHSQQHSARPSSTGALARAEQSHPSNGSRNHEFGFAQQQNQQVGQPRDIAEQSSLASHKEPMRSPRQTENAQEEDYPYEMMGYEEYDAMDEDPAFQVMMEADHATAQLERSGASSLDARAEVRAIPAQQEHTPTQCAGLPSSSHAWRDAVAFVQADDEYKQENRHDRPRANSPSPAAARPRDANANAPELARTQRSNDSSFYAARLGLPAVSSEQNIAADWSNAERNQDALARNNRKETLIDLLGDGDDDDCAVKEVVARSNRSNEATHMAPGRIQRLRREGVVLGYIRDIIWSARSEQIYHIKGYCVQPTSFTCENDHYQARILVEDSTGLVTVNVGDGVVKGLIGKSASEFLKSSKKEKKACRLELSARLMQFSVRHDVMPVCDCVSDRWMNE